MDKLQPLIKYQYWICFGLAVIFVVTGWWMASGAIATETTQRKDIVDKAFAAAAQGATEPNEQWVQAAKKENESDNQAYNSASAQLWKRQQNARRWPPEVENELKGVPYLDQIKSSETRAKWASIYKDQIEKLLAIVRPFKDGEGLVVVDVNSISHRPFNSWRYGPPASPEIWNNQEDIWLLQSILTSIARVNEGANRLTESQVRQINRLTLRGGDRNAKPTSGGGGFGGGGGGFGGAMGMGMKGGDDEAGMGMGMGMGVGGGDSASHPGKEFEGATAGDILVEEFGADAGAGAGAGVGAGGFGAAMGMGKSSMGMSSPMSMSSGPAGTDGAAKTEEKRFVDEQPGYKTRAFLLDVIVRDDQLPNLLASLTNSDFPVEIVRVDITAAAGKASGGMGDRGGMMSGGAGMGGDEDSAIGIGLASSGASSMKGGMRGGMGMGMGMGAGLGSGGAAGSSMAPGMMSSAPGAMMGMGSGGAGLGMGMGMGSGMGMGIGSGVGTGKGNETLQAAMMDPLLINVRIGGLMTLYQSAQESNTQAATEKAEPITTPVLPAGEEGASDMTDSESPSSTGEASGTESNTAAVNAGNSEPSAEGSSPTGADPAVPNPATVAPPNATGPSEGSVPAPGSEESTPAAPVGASPP
jgi:hypothetical protein